MKGSFWVEEFSFSNCMKQCSTTGIPCLKKENSIALTLLGQLKLCSFKMHYFWISPGDFIFNCCSEICPKLSGVFVHLFFGDGCSFAPAIRNPVSRCGFPSSLFTLHSGPCYLTGNAFQIWSPPGGQISKLSFPESKQLILSALQYKQAWEWNKVDLF